MIGRILRTIWEQFQVILGIYLKFAVLAALVYAVFAWYVMNFDQPVGHVVEVVKEVEETSS